MYKLFKEHPEDTPVTYKYYYCNFVKQFNLGFGNPRQYVCSYCGCTNAATDECPKRELNTKLLVHRMRDEKLYTLLKELQPDDTITGVFDLMQDQALPKSPTGYAYYARQLWLYFIAIVEHKVGQQTRVDASFYSWGEHQQGRGSNQVAGSVYDLFIKRLTSDPGTQQVRLLSDSCTGQNRTLL